MPDLWETFGRMWTYEFMVREVVVTAIAGAICAIISCWIVLVGWSLMDDTLSHAVLSGVVIAHMLGIPYSVGALAAALLVVGLIFTIRQTSHLKSDASMGIVFTTLSTIGLVFVSKNPSDINLSHVLLGDLLGVTQANMWQVLTLGLLVGAVLLLKRKDLTAYAFDPAHLRAIGFPVWRMGVLLLVCLAMTVVTVIQAVGAILIVTLLITPGATALFITQRFSKMLLIASTFSVAPTIVSVYVSYWFDTAPGAIVMATGGFLFFAVWLTSPCGLRSSLKSRRAAA